MQSCLHHCRDLSAKPTSDQSTGCPESGAECQRYRRYMADGIDSERALILSAIESRFKLGETVDIAEFIHAINANDRSHVQSLIDDVFDQSLWVNVIRYGLGHDWNGVKASIVLRVVHPRLRAVLGLILSATEQRLTIGEIAFADAPGFARALCNPSLSRHLPGSRASVFRPFRRHAGWAPLLLGDY